MRIEIPAFEYGEAIPEKYSRRGGNCRPAISFIDVPRGARSLALIVDDPDAPHGLFTHWIVFNLDPASRGLPENEFPPGALQAANSWGEPKYGGPQPPDREHRYFFTLYALDTTLPVREGASRGEVERAMEDHILAEAKYMGRYAPHFAEVRGS